MSAKTTKQAGTTKPAEPPKQPGAQKQSGMEITIPSPPQLLLDLDRLMAADNVNMQAVAARIAQDAGVTAQIFRTLTAPAYGLKKAPDSLGKAVSILGLKSLHDLVKGACLRQSINAKGLSLEPFWERSADVARLASTIAWTQRTVCNVLPEHAHMVGLFHDCGIPVLAMHHPNYCKEFCRGDNVAWPDIHKEDQKFNTDHTVVGYMVAKHWHLPDYVCDAVRYHHEIVQAEHKAATLVSILQMAIHIYNQRYGQDDSEWLEIEARVLDELGIHPDGLHEFEDDIAERCLTTA